MAFRQRMRRFSNNSLFWLASILLAGGLLRFYGLTVGFPFEFHVDEWFIIRSSLEMYRAGTFKPPAFDYPSLVYYLPLACAYLVGLFREPTSYDLHVFGRAFSATLGTATIAVVYLTGKRTDGVRAGLLAAAFFAFTVTPIREAHYYTTDTLNLFFITLAVYFIIRVALGDPRRNYLYAGLAVGMAAGTKYNGAFICVPFLFAHAARVAGQVRPAVAPVDKTETLRRGLLSGWPLAAGLLAAVAFFATTPYALVARAEFLKDLNKMGTALSQRITEGNHHYIGTTPYWYYVENLLWWAMNPLLEAACLLGFVYALARRRRRQDIVIALWLLVYFAVVGGWLNKAVRYTLPLIPFLELFAAAMFVETAERFRAEGKRRAATTVSALAFVTLASAFLYSCAYMNIYRRPHTGIQATRWALENIPAGATILLEDPTPHERPPVDGQLTIYRDARLDAGARRFKFVYLPVPELISKDADEAQMRAELDETLKRADYIVMSMRWYEGLVHSPEASPVIRDYYRTLFDGNSGFELVREITSYPGIAGLELRDDSAELNFRIFDHPKVWIFRRKKSRG